MSIYELMRDLAWKKVVSGGGLTALLLLMTSGLTGCLVAGYSSGGELYIWPGSIVITLVLLLIFFLRRGR